MVKYKCRMVVYMKKEFSDNAVELFAKTLFHYVPNILSYINEIKDPRKSCTYKMNYLIMSEMCMFSSAGGSQRFTQTAFKDNNFLENISRLTKDEVLDKVPDAEIYTNVFKNIKQKEIEDFQYKINYYMLRNKIYEKSKILNKYNIVLDSTRFQKAHKKVSQEWLSQTVDGQTTYYVAVEEAKLVANEMAVSLCNEIIKNTDGKEKQDCEINAAKRLIQKIKEYYPRLPIRIIADSLYPCKDIIKICEKNKLEYIFVLKDEKIPTLTKEFFDLVGIEKGNIKFEENKEKAVLILWVNKVDYEGLKTNIIRQITYNKDTKQISKWMWITNREVSKDNVEKIIICAKTRDYVENQGFKEQKVTTGIDLEHVYSKDIKAIKVIYTIIQIVHLILQIIEHSDIVGNFAKKYGSVKVFCKIYFAHLIQTEIKIEKILQTKIQIRYPNSTIII